VKNPVGPTGDGGFTVCRVSYCILAPWQAAIR
jgi:hypothetical protein